MTISEDTRLKVIKSRESGLSFNKIATELNISKGSVVNIIKDHEKSGQKRSKNGQKTVKNGQKNNTRIKPDFFEFEPETPIQSNGQKMVKNELTEFDQIDDLLIMMKKWSFFLDSTFSYDDIAIWLDKNGPFPKGTELQSLYKRSKDPRYPDRATFNKYLRCMRKMSKNGGGTKSRF